MSSSSSPVSTVSVRRLELGLVELGEVAERLHHARGVARVAQRHLDQMAVLGGRRAGPASFERLEAGDRRRQRRAQVVREVAHALAPEVVGAAERVPLAPADVEQHLERARELPELVLGRRRQRAARRDGEPFGEAALRQRRHRLGQAAQRPGHGRDDEHGEQRRQRDDGDHRAERGPREAAAQRVPASLGKLLRVEHEIEVAGIDRRAACARSAHRLGDDDGAGIHALRVVAHDERGVGLLDRFAHRREGDARSRLERRRAGLGEDRAVGAEQVELGVGLEQDERAQPAAKRVGVALVHVEDVVVHADDAREKAHAAPVRGLVLEALERVDDRRDDEQRGDEAGREDRERELGPNAHVQPGTSRIL